MTTRIVGKGQVAAVAKQLIAGTAKRLTATTPIVLAGSSFTPDQITSKLQQLVNLRSAVDAAKASSKARIAEETTQAPSLIAFVSDLRAYVKVTFRDSPEALADFGITPKVRVPLTGEAKALATAKRAATRAARHTMGSNQRKAVKGDVTGVVVTPIAGPTTTVTAPSSPTTPAPGAGPTAASSPTTPATSAGREAIGAATPRTG
jgi:hypothetical protein